MDDEFYFTQPTADVSDDNVFRQPVINQVPVLYVYSPSGEKIIEFPLVKKHVTIGRDPSCDICIKSSSFLSREHGVFELNENYFCTITDLGSLNGITRNNLQLKPRISYELRDGDYLCFGDIYCTLRFCPSNMKVGLNTTFDHESCMEHNETLVQTNLSTDQKDSSGSDDADSSVLSEGVLTEIVVDTNDVSRDLLPNPVYFLPSRSHSLSNSLDSDCKKNDGTHSLSDSSQSRMHDNKHVSDNEINQDSGAKLFVGVTRQHTEKTSLESSIKSLKTRCSSGEIIPTVTMTLLSGASSTPLVCSRSNMILARDSDPGCIDQSIDNHLTSNAPSSTCLSIDESGLIIEESDLVTTISMKKSIDEATASNNNISSKDISHLHDTHNNMVEHPRPNSSCKSYVMLHVDESLMNSDDVNMKNSNPDCSSKSQIAGRSRLRKSDIQDNALPKKCFDIKFSQEWGDDVRQEVVSLGDEEVKSSHVNTTTIRSNRSNQEVCCDMGLGEKQPVPDDRLTASVSREGKENSKIRQSKNLQSNLKISIDEVGSSVNEALLKRKRKSIQSNEDCDETCFGNLHRSPSNEYFKDKNCNNELNQKNSLLHRQNKVAPSRKPNQRNMRRRRLETSVQSDPLAMPLRKSSRLSIHRYGVTMIKSETITLDVSTTSSVSSKTSGTSLIHLLFSGIESSSYASTLQKLGARETEDSMLANYLVTDQIKRTLKTLYSRARGIPIISVEWLKACKVSRKGPNPDPLNFMLHYYSEPVHRPVPSRRSSKRASVQLSRRLQTSETGDNGETDGFLSGWSFCCTQNVVPPLSDLRKLTELSGGYWMSDEDLMNCVNSSPKLVKSVIITTQEDYDAVSVVAAKSFRKSSRSLKNTASRNHNSALSQALSTLVKVSVDWFLQTIMNRQPPVWPVDSQYTIQ